MENIKKIEEMLRNSIFEVFEKMFFVFAEPYFEGEQSYQLRTVIRFTGPFSGEMQVLLALGLAKTMAGNMLNLKGEEVSAPIIADCVKESINMICGSFLRKVDPVHGANMSIPEYGVITGAGDQRDEQKPAVNLAFMTENGAFEVRVMMQACS